VELPLVTQ